MREADKSMRSVQRLKDGPIVRGTGDMLKETRQFYVYLYTEEGIEESAQDMMLNKIKTKLTDEQAHLCEGEVSYDEITQAVSQTQNDRSPGTDGLTYSCTNPFGICSEKILLKFLTIALKTKNYQNHKNTVCSLFCLKRGREHYYPTGDLFHY